MSQTPSLHEATRHLPVRPDLKQLKHQAKELLRSVESGDPAAIAEFAQFHPRAATLGAPKLADAQWVLARSYGVVSWPRLVRACEMTDAIWRNDAAAVRNLVLADPSLLTEDARGIPGNWGPPMSYAATVGQDELVDLLSQLGASDVQFAFERACLKGNLSTARRLHALGGRPKAGSIMGPCETLNAEGLAFLIELGAPLTDEHGDPMAPIGLILQTYTRNARGKHGCLALFEKAGVQFPDTPPMAVHRGRRDFLERHLQADPLLFSRTYSHEEIYPRELGCSEDPTYALHGTPLAGGTLLHLCVDFDECEIAEWILQSGGSANALAAVNSEGFGGHTALFGTIVSQPYRANCSGHERFTRLLLDHGADTSIRASLRKALRFVEDESLHEYREVTAKEWGQQFHDQDWVNPAALRLL